MTYTKYPRTFHLPWSAGVSNDDRVLKSIEHFVGKRIVVTEKLDGENTTMYSDHIHARSLDSRHHDSRSHVKSIHSSMCFEIPVGWRICGENMYAKHSIHYTELPSYFMVFSIWDEWNEALSWEETEEWSTLFGLKSVPVLYKGLWDEELLRSLFTGKSALGGEQEGYVVRIADGFAFDGFQNSVAKFVRANHVQTDKFWMHSKIEPNFTA